MRRAAALALLLLAAPAAGDPPPKPEGAVRVAVFNAALSRDNPGELVQRLRLGDWARIDIAAEIVQRVRPDALLLLEIDFDPRGVAAGLFRERLKAGAGGAEGIDYPHLLAAPVNTGAPSGFDLDGDGRTDGPRDAFGFGRHEGHYGMALLSRLPFDAPAVRTFQTLLWADLPGALLPRDHFGAAAGALRLSSKSHWDAPVTLPDGRRLHLLAAHPTPPVFDGPEDANGRRNHDEVRFWIDYIGGADWIADDAGRPGGLPPGALWVALGDFNLDPEDGAGRPGALRLLEALGQDAAPRSEGGRAAADAGHRGDPARDTAAFRPPPKGPGNLRVDHVIPSKGLEIVGAGVLWPAPGDPLARLLAPEGSDHRLVWVDLR